MNFLSDHKPKPAVRFGLVLLQLVWLPIFASISEKKQSYLGEKGQSYVCGKKVAWKGGFAFPGKRKRREKL